MISMKPLTGRSRRTKRGQPCRRVLLSKVRFERTRLSAPRFLRFLNWPWLRTLFGTLLVLFFIVPGASAALRTWDGGGTNTFWNNPTNWAGDVAPVAGDDLLFPAGALNLVNVNNFPAGTTFNSLIFAGGGYSLSGNSIALNAGILATNGAGNFVGNSLILNSNQVFTIQPGSTSFTLLGAIDNNGKDLTFGGNVSGTLVQVQSVIS